MPKKIVKYACQVCGVLYGTEERAVLCETQPVDEPKVAVGDIVFTKAGFGWFDGDKRWVSNLGVTRQKGHGNCFGECCTMRFYYVVTAVDRDKSNPHRIRYHLLTKAMSGNEGYRSGVTYNEHHVTPVKVKSPPPEVVADSKDVIGETTERLL